MITDRDLFSTDTLDLARLGIEASINYTIKAIQEKGKLVDYIGLVEVNEIGNFNYEIFVRKNGQPYHHHDNFNFKTVPQATRALVNFINDLEELDNK